MSTGAYHTCGTRSDHTLWCWGDSQNGALGDGTGAPHALPGQVGTATTWSSVAPAQFAYFHSCATSTDGGVWCWGENSLGEIGDGTVKAAPRPVRVQ